jgi:PAS domain S-box-containing protein
MADNEEREILQKENRRLREENTRYRSVMENLSIHERMFHTLFESGHDAVLLLEGQVVSDCNKRSVEVFQFRQEELLGKNILNLSPQSSNGQSREQLVEFFEETNRRGTHFFEWTFRRKDGVTFPAEVSLGSFSMGSYRYYLVSIRDITFRKSIEHDLRTRTAQLQATLESIPFDFWINDTRNRTLLQNSYSKKLWGDTYGKHMESVTEDESIKEWWRESNARALEGELVEREQSYRIHGKEHIYRNIVAPVRDNGRVIGILGLNIEVTDYKQTQNRLKKTLEEREILLREIHHRVKNNLQIIVSMINLQKSSLAQGEGEALMEIENRISSMALIHDQLYNAENLEVIHMPDYIERLADSILSAFDLHNEGPELKLDTADIDLSLDMAIPLGIITNELLTNCIKHAFVDREWGIIGVQLSQTDETQEKAFRLVVYDNGRGMEAKGESTLREGGLGLTLVEQLIHQIYGEVEYSTENGFATIITFGKHR